MSRGKSFPREGQSAVPPRGLTIFWCIYSRFSIFCLNIWCFLKLFAQLSLIRRVYNNPGRRKRATIVCFLKKILQGACTDVFTRPTLLGFHANGRNIVALRFASHRTIEMLGLVWPKVWPVSNCTQQVPTSANIVVVPCKRTQQVTTMMGPTMFKVLLANNVASVCIDL